MIKVTKDHTFVRVQSHNGASYALPIEVIKGIKSGEGDPSWYDWAFDFLVTEDHNFDITISQMQKLYEDNL